MALGISECINLLTRFSIKVQNSDPLSNYIGYFVLFRNFSFFLLPRNTLTCIYFSRHLGFPDVFNTVIEDHIGPAVSL